MTEELPTSLARLITMLGLIPRLPGKVPARALQEKLRLLGFEIDLRSVQRDLQKLKHPMGLVTDDAKPAGWSYKRNARPLVLPVLDAPSALTLNMIEQYLVPLWPRSLLEIWRPQFDEARRTLDSGKFGKWRHRVAMVPSGPARLPVVIPDGVVEVVYNALLDGLQFEADYRAVGAKPERYTFNPLGLVHREGMTYLVGTREGSNHIPLFALHRMKNPVRLERPLHEPEGFDLRNYIENERQFDWPVGQQIKLKLRLGQGVQTFFEERPLSSDQKVQRTKAGYGAHLTATVQDTMSMRWWLMSFGASVEVLAPKSLRQSMAASLDKAARQYSGKQR
ncbi:MAG: WYL domain-containing protein [Rhodanobacteraceae bacterium]|nr:MAG: WYL domain-containing protein [Rhodanobacteraceae bacterium]